MLNGISGMERPRRRSFPRIHDHDLHPTSPHFSNVFIVAGCSRPVLRVQALRVAYAASGLMGCSASCFSIDYLRVVASTCALIGDTVLS